MKRLILSLFASCVAAVAACGADLPLDTLPASAKWVLHLDVKALRDTAPGKEILAAIPGSPIEAPFKAFEALTSIHVTRDVDAITLCGASGPMEPGGTIYLRGKWNLQRLRAIAGGADDYAAAPFGKHTLVSWLDKQGRPGARRQHACFVSASLVLLSDREENLKRALDAIDGKMPSLAAVPRFRQLAQPDSRHCLRVVALDVKDLLAANPQTAALWHVETLHLGLGADEQGVYLDAEASTVSPEAAAQVQQMLMGFQYLALLQAAMNPDAAQLAQSARISVAGRDVRVSVTLALDFVRRLIVKGKAQEAGGSPPPWPGKF